MQKFFHKVEIPFFCIVKLAIKRQHRNAIDENNQVWQGEGFAEVGWLGDDHCLVVVVSERQDWVSFPNSVLDTVPHEEANPRVEYVGAQIEIFQEIHARH